jgi:hypothetical protein
MKIERVLNYEEGAAFQTWMEEKDFTLVVGEGHPEDLPREFTAQIKFPPGIVLCLNPGDGHPSQYSPAGAIIGSGITEEWAIRDLLQKLNDRHLVLCRTSLKPGARDVLVQLPEFYYYKEQPVCRT